MNPAARIAILAPLLLALAATAAAAGPPGPARFAARVDNAWFPLAPGSVYVYRGVKDGRAARDVVTVTRRTKRVQGIPCVVVEDRLFLDGRLAERTTDWYAQDDAGNVWYFGEATAELDRRGRVTSTEGSWQAGRDGAVAGIYMPARPRVGGSGRQEYLAGEAEDHYRVVDLHASVTVPSVSSRSALLTEEWTPLEPGVLDRKLYVRGIGVALEQAVKGGDERLALVSFVRSGPR
jgi:hypothetical protein